MSKGGSIVINKVSVVGSKISYRYEVEGGVAEAFNNSWFEIDYFGDISKTPESIAIIPLLTNILPIAWVYGATIKVGTLDEGFFMKVKDIMRGYQKMYPNINFVNNLIVEKISKNEINKKSSNSILLFSGGVDATSSLITMLNDGMKPRLVTLWGADVSLDDVAGWKEKSAHTKKIASLFNLKHSFVKTNFRSFINEGTLDKIAEKFNEMWWHGFQYGIGILGHAAPLIYKHNVSELHMASTYANDESTCASNKSIDEQFTVAGNKTIYNGDDKNRQQKIANICNFKSEHKEIKRFPLKVCWQSEGAKNCCRCEKCMRTACGFLAEGGELKAFSLENFDGNYCKNFILKRFWTDKTNKFLILFWTEVQSRLIKNNPTYLRKSDNIDWLKTVDFTKINNKPSKRIRRGIKVVSRTVRRLIPQKIKNIIKRT